MDNPVAARQAESTGGWDRIRRLPELAVRVYRDARTDRLPGLAAEVAFYSLLSLAPLLLVFLSALSFVGQWAGPEGVERIVDQILDWSRTFLTTSTVSDVVEPAIRSLLSEGREDILSIAVVVTVWSASRVMRVVVSAVTRAYDLEDTRTWAQRTGLAIALTIGAVLTAAIVLPLLVLGPEAGAGFADQFGLQQAFEVTWRVLYWPVVAIVGISLLTWVYHIIPPWVTAWRRDLPGAVFALAVWAGGSFGIRVYAVTWLEANSAYQVVAAPLVLLLWIYVTSLALLLGAELNAEIEKMWPIPGSPYWHKVNGDPAGAA